MARFLAVTPSAVDGWASTGNNAMPQCTFNAVVGRRHVALTANVDTSPQPYFRLERTAVETGQELIGRSTPQPLPVYRLGVEAYWFAAQTKLLSTDGVRLITGTVTWPAGTERRSRALAETVSRTYLRPVIKATSPSMFAGPPAPP